MLGNQVGLGSVPSKSDTGKDSVHAGVYTYTMNGQCLLSWDMSLQCYIHIYMYIAQGCSVIAKALSVPAAAVLFGLLSVFSFMLSHSHVKCVGTRWSEPVIVWMVVAMPTGSGKTTLFKFLLGLIQDVRKRCNRKDIHPSWTLEEASFEKMGELMAENNGKLLGLYDELSAFLTGINLYNSKGLSDSRDLHKFLQLYNGLPWKRRTGKHVHECSVSTTEK